jgi:plasmid stabilization system protein ParE
MTAPRVHRTPEAVADIDAIWNFIAIDSFDAADRVVDELADCFQLLAENPGVGELQPSLADGTYRRFTHRSYVIYFRPIVDGIVVVRVLHSASDHERLV